MNRQLHLPLLSPYIAIRSEDIPLSEQNITQLYQQAKEQVKWSLFK